MRPDDAWLPSRASGVGASGGLWADRPLVPPALRWDLLLRAYWDEFAQEPKGRVLLRIKTYLPSWEPASPDCAALKFSPRLDSQ